ncbi:MAG: 5-bromo-4-chloroindolyl phosphate hydrolysis family protein [Anaerovoracaceae bacterium]
MNNDNQKSYFDIFKNPNGSYHIPIWLIIIGFCVNWMLGIGLLFAHLCEDKTSTIPYEDAPYDTPEQNAPKSGQSVKRTVKTTSKSKKKKNPAAVLTGLGIFAAAVGVLDLPDSVQYLVWCIQNDSGISYGIRDVAQNCIWILSGLAMLLGAKRLQTGQRRRSKIAAIVGDAKYMQIAEIAEALPASRSKTEKYLQQCIDSGMFGEKAYLDMRSDCLVVSGPAPMSKKEQEAAEAARKAAEAAEETLDEYGRILKEIRDINNKIPGEEFSAKIDRLEDLTSKIFKLVQEQPEKQKKLRKFINYYLPTSLKLLHSYEQLDAQGIEGKNISESKQQIEETMDTMISAFEKQLDNLFTSESMDISADIAAMQNLMRADGLIENEFSEAMDKSKPGEKLQ